MSSSEKLERLRSFLARDPGNAELACDLVDLQFALACFAEARATLVGLPSEGQAQPGVQFRLARLDLVIGDYAEAEQKLGRLLNAGHDLPVIGHDLAFSQLCQHRLDDATDTLNKTIGRHGATTETRVLQARVALMRREYALAHEALDEALSLEPDSAVALGLRALARLDAGDAQNAQEAADLCLSRYPDQHEALLTAGSLALWQHDVVQADLHFTQALARFPNSGRALSGRGQVLMLSGRLEEALPVLGQAVMAMPDHIGTWHALGWIQLLHGDLACAEKSYRTAYELDRNFAESHGGLAVVALLQGRYAEGEAGMKRALRLDPRCNSGRYARTLWLDWQGEHAQSVALFAELMAESALPGVHGEDAETLAARLKTLALSVNQAS